MSLKKLFIVAMTCLSVHSLSAQEIFNEVSYSPAQTTFRLVATVPAKAPRSYRVQLHLFKDSDLKNPFKVIRMSRPAGGDNRFPVWQATVRGDLKGCFYAFRVPMVRKALPVQAKHSRTFTYGALTPGLFAKAVSVNGQRGAVIDLREADPEGGADDVRPVPESAADWVIYELHHRDFSIDASSGLRHKGKFLALTEPKAIRYLQDLGVTAVHLLPSFDYASVDETRLDKPQYNWGYDPLNYNVPEGSYATDPYDPKCRIREFKMMVQALHKAGIRVILDVVYNHTFDLSNSNFQRTNPDLFYRFNADGTPSNGSGCGNETASERPLMRQYMIESMKYWVNEYHIDGFRVDLMGVHDIETMNRIRAELSRVRPSVFIYGEGWSAGACAYPQEKLAMKANMKQMPGIAAFSDELRDALRGPFNDDRKGAFLAGIPGSEESIKAGIAGMIAHPDVDYSRVNYAKEPWAEQPSQMISYVSCHDDMCLVDRLRAVSPGIGDDELIRLSLLAQTAVLTSQGVPFILSGEEMLRDKKGVHNSFNSPDSINRLDWNNLQRYPKVFDYYSRLISLRKHHPAFGGSGNAETVRRHLRFLPTQDCVVGFSLTDYPGDAWKHIVVVLNANREAREVEIPAGTYTVVCCDGTIDEGGLGTMEGGKIIVDPQSALIIYN